MPTTAIPRPLQYPILPWEITDAIIDHLNSDVRALGVCSGVCTEWLIRSRYHIFSTVQLWPWRAKRFFDLASSEECTFVSQIRCIEFDDLRTVESVDRGARENGERTREDTLFIDAMSFSDIPCFKQVQTITVRNVDWTSLPMHQQCALRNHLAHFHHLNRLEFHGVVFHDMREVARVVDSFPALYHLTANVTFMKFLEHTIASAMANPLPDRLRSVEMGTYEGIPVMLNSITGRGDHRQIRELKLQHIKADHLEYIQAALRKTGSNLRHLSLGFERDSFSRGETLDLSSLSQLQTLRLEGLSFTKLSTPGILESLESSFLESVDLRICLEDEATMKAFNWSRVERALMDLHFFGMKFVIVVVEVSSRGIMKETKVESWIAQGMSDLHSRGALRITIVREGSIGEVDRCSVISKI